MTEDPEAPHGRKKGGTPKKAHSGGFARGGKAYAGPPKGVGAGDGWGGPAKGEGVNPKASPEAGAEALAQYRSLTEEQRERLAQIRALREIEKEERLALMEDNILHIALTAEAENVRLSASTALANRLGGMPIQANKVEAETTVIYNSPSADDDS